MDRPITLEELNILLDRLGLYALENDLRRDLFSYAHSNAPTFESLSEYKKEEHREITLKRILGNDATWLFVRQKYERIARRAAKEVCRMPYVNSIENTSEQAVELLEMPLNEIPTRINDPDRGHQILIKWRLEIGK